MLSFPNFQIDLDSRQSIKICTDYPLHLRKKAHCVQSIPYFYFIFFISDIESDIAALRSQNPRLLVLASLGGEAVKATTFSSFITDRESLNNLTSSINNHYRSGLLDGVEIDWEWPFAGGDKKDRIKMIRYARVRKTINFVKIFNERDKKGTFSIIYLISM